MVAAAKAAAREGAQAAAREGVATVAARAAQAGDEAVGVRRAGWWAVDGGGGPNAPRFFH